MTLWEHGTRATPDSYIAFENLGQALRERGAYAESIRRNGLDAWRSIFGSALCLLRLKQADAAKEAWTMLTSLPIPDVHKDEFAALAKTLFNLAKEMQISLTE